MHGGKTTSASEGYCERLHLPMSAPRATKPRRISKRILASERRAYLLSNHDFVCGCARCEAEAADEAAEADRPPLPPDCAP